VLIDRRISGIQRPHEGFAATQIHQASGSGFFRDNVLVEASEAAICNVLPGQMGYSSTLSDRKDVTRVDCRIEDVVYLVPLMDAERCALTCV
jgi:hypothetical protein